MVVTGKEGAGADSSHRKPGSREREDLGSHGPFRGHTPYDRSSIRPLPVKDPKCLPVALPWGQHFYSWIFEGKLIKAIATGDGY